MKKWLCIDFGDSYSAAAYMSSNQPTKVKPLSGLYDMYGFPSVAYVDKDGTILAGKDALPWKGYDPSRFIRKFKNDLHKKEIPFIGVTYSDILAALFREIKCSAEYQNGGSIFDAAILTVPDSYVKDDPRKVVLEEAAKKAGFIDVKYESGSVAVAKYFCHISHVNDNSVSIVYDIGSGMSSAILRHKGKNVELLGRAGDDKFGGEFFTRTVLRHILPELKLSDDLAEKSLQVQKLEAICNDIKERLSTQDVVKYPIMAFGKESLQYSRKDFESEIASGLTQSFELCSDMVSKAGLTWADIDRVIVVGGSSAMPCVSTLLKKYLDGRGASHISVLSNAISDNSYLDPLYSMALGGALITYSSETAYDKAVYYYQAPDETRNWLLAAYYFDQDYRENDTIESYNAEIKIFQSIINNLELENGQLCLNSILKEFGESSVDCLVELLVSLQGVLDSEGHSSFVSHLFKLPFWSNINNTIVNNYLNHS